MPLSILGTLLALYSQLFSNSPPPLLFLGEATSHILHPALGYPVQERKKATEKGLTKGYKEKKLVLAILIMMMNCYQNLNT